MCLLKINEEISTEIGIERNLIVITIKRDSQPSFGIDCNAEECLRPGALCSNWKS